LRLVYLGTPELAVPPLRALVAAGHDVRLVVTGADRRRGRGSATSPSPVKAAAAELGLAVTHDVDDALTVGAELGVVVAFGKLIRAHVLAALPMVNLHFSRLPRWRGAAPVERALLAGDELTGVCVMRVDEALDAGPIYACRDVPIRPGVTVAELRAELVDVGTHLLVETLAGPLPEPTPQCGETTYARKIDPDELRLDWTSPAEQLVRWVRVGGTWTTFRDKRLKVRAAEAVPAAAVPASRSPGVLDVELGIVATGDGALRLVTVQPEGKGPMSWRDFANGVRPVAGERLG
jgi:methionyl-tRNA formyltransferase